MNPRGSRWLRVSSVLSALAVVLLAMASAGSASAATQHWATSSQLPFGSAQSYTMELNSLPEIHWQWGSEVRIPCTGASTHGQVEQEGNGEAGRLTSSALILSGCEVVGLKGCSLGSSTITLASWSETAVVEGNEVIRTGSQNGEFGLFDLVGSSCMWKGSGYRFEGQLHAEVSAKDPTEWGFFGSEFKIEGEPASMFGARFHLNKTGTTEHLMQSAAASPGAPHWYLNTAAWTDLSAGPFSAYESNQALAFHISTTLALAKLEIDCTGTKNGMKGSLQNPAGGGAGLASASITLAKCSDATNANCVVEAATSPELTGAAIEAGPAVEFARVGGGSLITIVIAKKEGLNATPSGPFS